MLNIEVADNLPDGKQVLSITHNSKTPRKSVIASAAKQSAKFIRMPFAKQKEITHE
jgi:hypothetical protein